MSVSGILLYWWKDSIFHCIFNCCFIVFILRKRSISWKPTMLDPQNLHTAWVYYVSGRGAFRGTWSFSLQHGEHTTIVTQPGNQPLTTFLKMYLHHDRILKGNLPGSPVLFSCLEETHGYYIFQIGQVYSPETAKESGKRIWQTIFRSSFLTISGSFFSDSLCKMKGNTPMSYSRNTVWLYLPMEINPDTAILHLINVILAYLGWLPAYLLGRDIGERLAKGW